MTETIPTPIMMYVNDPRERKKSGLSTPMPHTTTGVIDKESFTTEVSKDENCANSFRLMHGHLKNAEGMDQARRRGERGVTWESAGHVDEKGCVAITGSIIDVIIQAKHEVVRESLKAETEAQTEGN
jgi:hypothetical protein